MAKNTDPVVPDKITPQDLENKFKALQGDIQGTGRRQEDLHRHRCRRRAAWCCWSSSSCSVGAPASDAAPSSRSGGSDVAGSLRAATEVPPAQFVLRRGVAAPQSAGPTDRHAPGRPGRLPASQGIRQGLILGNPYWRAVGSAASIGPRGQQASAAEAARTPRTRAARRRAVGVTVAVSAPRLDLSRRARRAELKRLETEAVASVSAPSDDREGAAAQPAARSRIRRTTIGRPAARGAGAQPGGAPRHLQRHARARAMPTDRRRRRSRSGPSSPVAPVIEVER